MIGAVLEVKKPSAAFLAFGQPEFLECYLKTFSITIP
jgi:hypothetical protein